MQHHQDPSHQDHQETASPVNIDLIVDDKENIQPIREGRSAQTLSHLFATQLNDRVHELQQQHQQFQHDIEHSEDDDDPLDIHVRYIQWIVENYPQGAGQGHDSNLLSVLEQAMKAFKGDERYRNDPRYVRFYVQYSGIVDDPDHIFKFMMANNIGIQLAMLYEEYAEYLEDMEDYVAARDILTLGINRRAMPLGRLKKNRAEFELRAQKFEEEAEKQAMEEALLHGDATQGGSGQGPAARKVLGIKVSRTESIPTNASSHSHVALNSASSISTSQRRQGASNVQQPNGKLAVYSDTTSSSSAGAGAGRTSSRQGSNRAIVEPWKDLSTEQIRRKENMHQATPWQGVTLPSDVPVPKKAVRKLEVFQDPIPERTKAPATESSQHTPIPYVHVAENTLRSARAPLPIQLRDIAKISSRFPVELSEEGKPERLMFDQNEIYTEGEEYSIEEIRARRYHSVSCASAGSIPGAHPPSTSPPESPSKHMTNRTNGFDSMPCTPPQEAFSDDESGSLHQQHPVGRMLPISEEQLERRKRIAEHRRKMRESPTIHTVEADAYMNRMFSSDYRTKKRKADSDVEHTPAYLSEEARAILEDPVPQYDSEDDHDGSFGGEDCGTMTLAIREMRRKDSLERRRSAGTALPVDLTIAIAERRRIETHKDEV
ncbi:hypothetical protein BGZ82_010291 [Podila clonocystis]|nr:hypothetical protein BGZ82_010291 [Podila clonocystis]